MIQPYPKFYLFVGLNQCIDVINEAMTEMTTNPLGIESCLHGVGKF